MFQCINFSVLIACPAHSLHCLLNSFPIVYTTLCIHFIPSSFLLHFFHKPVLLVSVSFLAGTFFHNYYSDYLLYFVFECCLHSFIVYQTLWTYYLLVQHPFNQLIQLGLFRLKLEVVCLNRNIKICISQVIICLSSLQFILVPKYINKL